MYFFLDVLAGGILSPCYDQYYNSGLFLSLQIE